MSTSSNSIRNFLLAGTAFASMAAVSSAFAQDEPADEIVVYAKPIRDSQLKALEKKREADNVVDIISSDLIGRFPDQNLADSLGRVPGLAIERDQGQARFINFRGAPFRYTSIAFDGINVPGAEDGRIPRFDSIPSAVTSTIEVNKAITADMPGEATIGYININTFNPFDREGFHISAEGGYGWQTLGDVGIERANGRLSYSNDVFGILGFASHNKRGRITDNREYELSVDEATGELIPDNLDFRSYRGERKDNAYGGRIEVRPNDDVRIFVSSIYSEFIDIEERHQFEFDITDGLRAALSDPSATPAPTTGYSPVVLVSRLLEDGKYNNSTWTSTAGADFSLAGWDLEARVNYTETENETFLPIPFSAGGTVAASYDVSDILDPKLFLYQTGTMTPTTINSVVYPVTFGLIFSDSLDIDNIKVKLDASRDLEFASTPIRLKTGFLADLRDGEGGSAEAFGGFPSSVDISSFLTDQPWDTDFSNTIGGTNYDNSGLRDAWEEAIGGFDAAFDPASVIDLKENIYAGYVMGTAEFGWGSFVAGVRVEHTDFSTSGNLLVDGVEQPISTDKKYTDVLPSAHLNVNVAEDMKFRLSASTGVSRPTYTESRASTSVDVVNSEATGGNPDLDAEYSYGADASLEYYFAPASLISVGGFVRFIDNVIYPDTSVIADGSAIIPGVVAPGTPILYNSFYNGEDGKLYGLEASFTGQATFLPYPFDGFGASANVTLLDSEFKAPTKGGAAFRLPGASDVVFNASIYYEQFGLSARVNYQYRDDWLSTTENDSLTEYWGETKRLDATLRYLVPVQPGGVKLTLFADGNNLTDERDLRYINSQATPNQYEGFGRRFVFGARVDY